MNEQLKKMRKNRFSCREDIFLLRETVAQNPYKEENLKEMKKIWAQVLHNFMIICPTVRTERAIREHVEYLLQLYIKEDMSKLRRSGTEEDYWEKEQLLEELKGLKEEFQQPPRKKNKKISESLRQGATNLAAQKRIVTKCNCEAHAQDLSPPTIPDLDLTPPTVSNPDLTPPCAASTADMTSPAISYLDRTPHTVPNPDLTSIGAPSPVPARGKVRAKVLQRNCSKNGKASLFAMVKEKILKDIELEHRKLSIEEKREENESRRISVEEKKADNEARRLALEERKQAAYEAGQKQQLELMALLIEKISKT